MKKGNSHHAHIYGTFEAYVAGMCEYFDKVKGEVVREEPDANKLRFLKREWKNHIEKHGNVPMITKCGVCSGQELKEDIKHGCYKPGRPSKVERDEIRGKE